MGIMTTVTNLPELFYSFPVSTDRGDTPPLAPASWRILRNDTTAEPQRLALDSEAFEAGNTTPIYVTEPVQKVPLLNIIQFTSSPQKSQNEKEPGAGLIRERSEILQKWEGVVLFRKGETFTARIFEGYQDFPVKRANKISLQEVADEQHELVVPGATFSWTIGYRIRGGTRSRFSEIYFRRLPPWTKQELKNAETAAVKLCEEAGWF
jgi:hypothetical protein